MRRTMTVMGHLGADPEIKKTANGIQFTTMRLANSAFSDPENTTYWFNLTVWDENLQNFVQKVKLQKGSCIEVDGDYSNRTYTNRMGQIQISNDIRVSAIHLGPSRKDNLNTPDTTNEMPNVQVPVTPSVMNNANVGAATIAPVTPKETKEVTGAKAVKSTKTKVEESIPPEMPSDSDEELPF